MKMKLRDLLFEEYDIDKNDVAGREIIPNNHVYHYSDIENRDSILKHGLEPRVGSGYETWVGKGKKIIPALFATNDSFINVIGPHPDTDHIHYDVWEIDTYGLSNKWYVDKNSIGYGQGSTIKNIVAFEPIKRDNIYLKFKGA